MSMDAAWNQWIQTHPYLESIARFHHLLVQATGTRVTFEAMPAWQDYAEDYRNGTPLLRSKSLNLDYAAASGEALAILVDKVLAAEVPERLAENCRQLHNILTSPEERMSAIEWVVSGVPFTRAPPDPGVLLLLGWSAVASVLTPVIEAFSCWRNEEDWGRGYCPTCGAAPVMAQIVPGEAGSQRFLFCGFCGTRWKYRRIGCPYCGNEISPRLGILEAEGEEGLLRIDVCEECRGYVKTYTGHGEETLFLADWTTLHLDILARERGFKRQGDSLYEI
ncbi:MAG: formate dehydrogenase accessory protein FdhE [Betaproteobacteria bacterium ADurb.Bin341]|nr:MAG: formate dehydrogenase accessory protein FdhE [Betaproteobacteria bacterium ADurb.Bin341]